MHDAQLTIPKASWYQATKERRSRRRFNNQALIPKDQAHLEAFSQELNKAATGFRAMLVVKKPDDVFKGAIGPYGKIKNAPGYVAFVGDAKDPNVQEKTGYFGECFILDATQLGISTCWVGGFFNRSAVKDHFELSAHEQVLAISPVGYTDARYSWEERVLSGVVRSHKRKDLSALSRGLPVHSWPQWVQAGMECARIAPSAVNRQPWRFTIDTDAVTVAVDSPNSALGVDKRLDCGIAMLHFEVGALHAGVSGKWEYLKNPEVARFAPL